MKTIKRRMTRLLICFHCTVSQTLSDFLAFAKLIFIEDMSPLHTKVSCIPKLLI